MHKMTDKQMAEKKKELRALMEKLEIGGEWWPQGYVIHSDHLDEVWDFIEELVEEVERETKKDKYIHRRQCIYCDTCGVSTNPMDTDADIVLSHSSIPSYRSDSCHMRRVIEAYNTETEEWTTLELLEVREPLKN